MHVERASLLWSIYLSHTLASRGLADSTLHVSARRANAVGAGAFSAARVWLLYYCSTSRRRFAPFLCCVLNLAQPQTSTCCTSHLSHTDILEYFTNVTLWRDAITSAMQGPGRPAHTVVSCSTSDHVLAVTVFGIVPSISGIHSLQLVGSVEWGSAVRLRTLSCRVYGPALLCPYFGRPPSRYEVVHSSSLYISKSSVHGRKRCSLSSFHFRRS